MSKQTEALKLALEALEEIALAGMSPAPEMIDSKEAFHARQAWRFIGIAARQLSAIREALAEQPAQPEQCQCPACKIAPHESDCPVHNEPAWPNGPCDCGAQPEQEPVAWRNAALRVGEDLCSVGPFGYYDMTAEQWLDWALSVVTVHAPPANANAGKPWVGLTDEQIDKLPWGPHEGNPMTFAEGLRDFARAIEAKLQEKNA